MKKIAVVYDWLDKWGGVERVLLMLNEIFEEPDFYTSYWNKDKAPWAAKLKIKTSFIQNLPGFIKNNRVLSAPLYPFAFESFDFSEYDIVISITSSYAKSIITKPGTRHICYLLTPTRFLWHDENKYLSKFSRLVLSPYLSHIKKWDKIVSNRPDKVYAISQTVADRCEKYYGRKCEVIYPGFNVKYWDELYEKVKSSRLPYYKNFYLVVSRLEKYKQVELAIKTFNTNGKKLVIVGNGSQLSYLKSIAKNNIEFLDEQMEDVDLAFLYTNASALIMPQEEDYGYVALESQICNTPVISYSKGGATETVIDGQTGIFFDKQSEKSLTNTIEKFEKMSYTVRQNFLKTINKFSEENFTKQFTNLIK